VTLDSISVAKVTDSKGGLNHMDFGTRELQLIESALCFLAANFEEEDWEDMDMPIDFAEVQRLVQKIQN